MEVGMPLELFWEKVHNLSLPQHHGYRPGSIHTIISDESGSLYFSDELNHTVASADSQGMLRWHKGGKGSAPAQFVYPRGLRLGWIVKGNEWLRALAVCDSWNLRIQFFSLSGDYLYEWSSAAGTPFGEVSDIRFLTPKNSTDPHEGIWLFLDRSNHCLWILRPDGAFISRIGRCLAPHLERAWSAKTMESCRIGPAGDLSDRFFYDPAYYPDRVLGSGTESLFIWEPLSKHLKQIFHGSLLPLPLEIGISEECVAADEGGILVWDTVSCHLTYYNAEGNPAAKACLEGRPVFSDLQVPSLWTQQGCDLSLCQLRLSSDPIKTNPLTLLHRCTRKKLDSLLCSGVFVIPVIDRLHETMRLLQASCSNFWESLNHWAAGETLTMPHEQTLSQWLLDLQTVHRDFASALQDAYPELFILLHIDPEMQAGKQAGDFYGIRRILSPIADAVEEEFIRLQARYDEISVWQTSASRIAEKHPPHNLSSIVNALKLYQQGMQTILQELSQIHNDLQSTIMLINSESSSVALHPSTPFLCLSPIPITSMRPARRRETFLHEIDRISVGDSGNNTPQHPHSFAQTSDRHIYVSLASGQNILHMDPSGKVLGRLIAQDQLSGQLKAPIGLAVDRTDRLWIADYLAHNIVACHPSDSHFVPIAWAPEDCTPLFSPHGVCCITDGSLVIGDTGNFRILRLTGHHLSTIVSRHPERGHGEFLHPTTLFIDPSDHTGSFWIVDHRNHRLQELDTNGATITQIGRCGFGNGRFIFPECAAFLPDGSLLVSQFRFSRELKLFDRNGNEQDRSIVDFAPAGILTYGRTILIADILGDQIRIFERT
jgi:hypothetical protein